ncbi:MAG TPA: hypothetical protein VJQ52_07600 [Steroidobacteraceae bacterium]|nr:hypothetical protein [Steroidobacteraceae bacterium]
MRQARFRTHGAVLTILLAAVLGCGSLSANPSDVVKEFTLQLPADIVSAGSVRLVLKGVSVPRNTPVVLRARALEPEVALGSAGLVAESPAAAGPAVHSQVKIDITHALRRWQQKNRDATQLKVRIVPYAGLEPIPQLEWSVESAQLEPAP